MVIWVIPVLQATNLPPAYHDVIGVEPFLVRPKIGTSAPLLVQIVILVASLNKVKPVLRGVEDLRGMADRKAVRFVFAVGASSNCAVAMGNFKTT
jgi:hypothetical protein